MLKEDTQNNEENIIAISSQSDALVEAMDETIAHNEAMLDNLHSQPENLEITVQRHVNYTIFQLKRSIHDFVIQRTSIEFEQYHKQIFVKDENFV